MEYIYSALLLHSAGKEITEDNIQKVLDAAGVKADSARIKALTASLDGVNIKEAISTAVAMPAAGAGATASPVAEPAGKAVKKVEKKEKKKEEKVSEEEAAAGLGALFG